MQASWRPEHRRGTLLVMRQDGLDALVDRAIEQRLVCHERIALSRELVRMSREAVTESRDLLARTRDHCSPDHLVLPGTIVTAPPLSYRYRVESSGTLAHDTAIAGYGSH